MKNLLWFHTFRGNAVADLMPVLQQGITPNTTASPGQTQTNERVLGLNRSVYAYLGRGSTDFGQNGFTVPVNSVPNNGHVSPFDTGGLVKHIHPVCNWPQGKKREFLKDYSWPIKDVGRRLQEYPSRDGLATYLTGQRPKSAGPHKIWTGTQGDIWQTNANTWQAWTWEFRTTVCLNAGIHVKFWTCPPHVFAELCQLAEGDPSKQQWYAFLAERYVPGGVSQMVRLLRDKQVTR